MAPGLGEPQCKVVLLGNGSVGKSSLCMRFAANGFSKAYRQTVGVDFLEKRVTLKGAKSVRMSVWDVGGQSVGSSMLAGYLSGANLVFLCYDVTDRASFLDLSDWMTRLKRRFPGGGMLPQTHLLGNKVDLIGQRVVSLAEAKAFAAAHGLQGAHEVSAQSGENVMRAIYECAAKTAGIPMSEYDLAFFDAAVAVTVTEDGSGGDPDGGRTRFADRIEAEDLAYERRKRLASQCRCTVA